MGARGPQRKPGSVRWNREVRKNQQIDAVSSSAPRRPIGDSEETSFGDEKLPTCPEWLSKPVAERWAALVFDMAVAGVPLKQLDARAVAIAAGYENDLADLHEMCANPEMDAEHRIAAIRLKNATRKDYLAALIAISGTPVARLRARIAPEEKPKQIDDGWGGF